MVAKHVEEMQKRSEEMNDKLSAGTYAYKQVRNIVVQAVGMGGGAAAGLGLAKALGKNMVTLPKFAGELGGAAVSARYVFGSIGAIIGAIGSTLVLGYEHWAKAEAEKLAVEEINKDISEAKLRMDPELMRENNALRAMVAKQDTMLKHHDGAGPHSLEGQTKEERPRHHVAAADSVHSKVHEPTHAHTVA